MAIKGLIEMGYSISQITDDMIKEMEEYGKECDMMVGSYLTPTIKN